MPLASTSRSASKPRLCEIHRHPMNPRARRRHRRHGLPAFTQSSERLLSDFLGQPTVSDIPKKRRENPWVLQRVEARKLRWWGRPRLANHHLYRRSGRQFGFCPLESMAGQQYLATEAGEEGPLCPAVPVGLKLSRRRRPSLLPPVSPPHSRCSRRRATPGPAVPLGSRAGWQRGARSVMPTTG